MLFNSNVVVNNKSTTTKNAGKLLAILIAMAMQQGTKWGTSPDGAHPRLHWKTLDATNS